MVLLCLSHYQPVLACAMKVSYTVTLTDCSQEDAQLTGHWFILILLVCIFLVFYVFMFCDMDKTLLPHVHIRIANATILIVQYHVKAILRDSYTQLTVEKYSSYNTSSAPVLNRDCMCACFKYQNRVIALSYWEVLLVQNICPFCSSPCPLPAIHVCLYGYC